MIPTRCSLILEISRYCSSSNHYVLRDSQQFRLISEGPSTLRALALRSCVEIGATRRVGSVPAVYYFEPGTKSKVILSQAQKSKAASPNSFMMLDNLCRG